MVEGGAASPITDEPDLRMVTETLTVDLYDVEAVVEADFLFRNEGGAREAVIAFPEIINQRHYGTWPRLRDVRFIVDGEAVSCERVPQDQSNRAGAEEGYEFTCWYAAKVSFAPQQERRVRISYSHRHGCQFEGLCWFPYTFSTARLWKGSVDQITMVLTCHEGVRDLPVRLPEGYRQDAEARRLTWEWRDFDAQPPSPSGTRPAEPPEWLHIYWWPNPPQVQVRGVAADLRAHFGPFGPILRFDQGGPWLPGYQAQRAAEDAEAWLIEANGHRLEVRAGQVQAALDGQPFNLTRAAEVFRDGGDRGHGLEACTLAVADLQRALGLGCDQDVARHSLDFAP
jgi:hypothetical protein